MLFILDNQPIRKLEYDVQKEVGRQDTWGLGANSDEQVNLFTRFLVPPDNITQLDFHLSLCFENYRSNLRVLENIDSKCREIALITLSVDDNTIIQQIQDFMKDVLVNYNHGVDRSFEGKILSIFSDACTIERVGYRRGFILMAQSKS